MSEELHGVLSYGGQRGPQGPKGDRGDGIYVKASIEECTNPGDAYFDEQGAMHILVELPDTWEITVPIEGEQGPQGEQGIQGDIGPTGYSGVYVGTEQPPEDATVWINPNGSESSIIGPTGPQGPTGASGQIDAPQAYGCYKVCRGEDGNIYFVTDETVYLDYSTPIGTAPSGGNKNIYTYLTAEELASISESGHIFNGWYLDQLLVNPATTNTIIGTDQTLYAKWDADLWEYVERDGTVVGAVAKAGMTELNDALVNVGLTPYYTTLETIDLSNSAVARLVSEDGTESPFLNYPNLTSFIFPTNPAGGYLSIDSTNYFRETKLTGSINYQKFNKLEKNSFVMMNNITSVNIGGTFTIIPDSCFVACANLITADFRGATNLTTIQPIAFQGCQKITTVYLPASIQNINYGAFSNTSYQNPNALTDIYFEGTTTQWNAITFNGDSGGSSHEYRDWNKGCNAITVHCSDDDIIIPANL